MTIVVCVKWTYELRDADKIVESFSLSNENSSCENWDVSLKSLVIFSLIMSERSYEFY